MLWSRRNSVEKMTVFVFPAIYVVSDCHVAVRRAALLVDQQSVESRPDALSIAMVPTPGSAAGECKARRDYEQDNRRRAAAGLPSLEEERAMAARERRKPDASAKSRPPAATANNTKPHTSPSAQS